MGAFSSNRNDINPSAIAGQKSPNTPQIATNLAAERVRQKGKRSNLGTTKG
jgi:hypothetical protein